MSMKQISEQYNEDVQKIKAAILQSQLETAKVANANMLSLYYGIGKFVSGGHPQQCLGRKRH